MLQSISAHKIDQKIRNPFSLLQEDEETVLSQSKIMQRQRTEMKPAKKHSILPFTKYEIKTAKTQQIVKKEDKNKQKIQQKPQKVQPSKENQEGKLAQLGNKQQNLDQQNSQQNIKQQEGLNLNRTQSNTQSDYTEEDEEKKFFLTKKHRQIKYELNADGDPPLLYDIGLDPQMIKDKLKLVLKMGEPDYDMIMNPDLAGPVLIAFAFGFSLLFSGQIHFGDIYALFIMGNLLLFILFNFMARKGVISLYNIMSVLGYCLLPMLILGICGIFYHLNTGFGLIFALLISFWSSAAGGNFLEALVKGPKNRKALIVYPLFLFYSSFAMIVIF